jgi:hypothetical protein
VKALQLAVSERPASPFDAGYGSYFATTRAAAARAFREADLPTRERGLDVLTLDLLLGSPCWML